VKACEGDSPAPPLQVRALGLRDYLETWQAMQRFTEDRNAATADELWWLEHPPVYTLGRAGLPSHLLDPGDTPVIHCDRGGQVTWHGPGQLVIYLLLDLGRRNLGVKALVRRMEEAVIALLADAGLTAEVQDGAPGVYVAGRKIASLGLRVRRHCTYHGLSLNVNNDLAPFARINPCGYPGLEVTSLAQLGIPWDPQQAAPALIEQLQGRLS
jgi:lipoyl(octanoyl) transferase